jgi:hypothetical protein
MNVLVGQVIKLGGCVDRITLDVMPTVLLINCCLVMLEKLLQLLVFLEGLVR